MDKDLQSIQQARELVKRAVEAQLEFRNFSQEKVDRVCYAMAEAGYSAATELGRMAYEETGFGKPEDKKLKNEFGTRRTWESIKDLKTVGVIRTDSKKKIVEIAEPMGVVAALIPSTNPTSTVMFKAIICVKGRNAMVAGPHPRAVNCTTEAVHLLADAAEKEGAPRGLISSMSVVTIEGTKELLRHRDVDLILATGSSAMVRDAYSVGKPAYGVGSGNVPVFIERTANIKKAVADLVSGKLFDYGTLCSTESAVVCDAPIKSQVVEEFKKRGGYFVTSEERSKLDRTMFDLRGTINPEVVGKPAAYIANKAGFSVPPETTVLIAELKGVGREYPLSREKLSPVLSFYTEDGWRDACHRCIELLKFGGLGHTLVIHSNDEDIIMKFALEKPSFRVLVNTQAALGAVGYTTGLDPSMTLGPGTLGGSIISENVTARHLIQVKRLAYETNPINREEKTTPQRQVMPSDTRPKPLERSWMDEIEERIRLKAGNPPVMKKEEIPAAKGASTEEEVKKSKVYGTGISEEEIQKIIRDFSK
ncbi:MAG: aldehyde dehydrogenase family protein [Bacteroidota bacterium]